MTKFRIGDRVEVVEVEVDDEPIISVGNSGVVRETDTYSDCVGVKGIAIDRDIYYVHDWQIKHVGEHNEDKKYIRFESEYSFGDKVIKASGDEYSEYSEDEHSIKDGTLGTVEGFRLLPDMDGDIKTLITVQFEGGLRCALAPEDLRPASYAHISIGVGDSKHELCLDEIQYARFHSFLAREGVI